MMEGSAARTALLVGLCLSLAGVTGWSFTPRAMERAGAGAPPPIEADSLSRYLEPASAAPRLDDYAVFLPAIEPAPRYVGPAPVVDGPLTEWELGAIMIAGGRPLAILNDETVAAGARLFDGSVVLEIGHDHVVIRAPNGTLRRLVMSAG